MASRLTVLYGETGVGKSSVLRAGVAHHLRRLAETNLAERGEPGLAVVVFDEWRGDPLPALRRAVAEAVTRRARRLAPAARRAGLARGRPSDVAADPGRRPLRDPRPGRGVLPLPRRRGGRRHLRGRLPRGRRQPRPARELPPRRSARTRSPSSTPSRAGSRAFWATTCAWSTSTHGRPRGDRRADLRVQPARRRRRSDRDRAGARRRRAGAGARREGQRRPSRAAEPSRAATAPSASRRRTSSS